MAYTMGVSCSKIQRELNIKLQNADGVFVEYWLALAVTKYLKTWVT